MAFFSSSPPSAPPQAWHPANVFGDELVSSHQLPSSPFGQPSSNTSLKPPRPAGGLFGQQPRRTTSSGSEASQGSHPATTTTAGQLSPSFDQTFQSSMYVLVSLLLASPADRLLPFCPWPSILQEHLCDGRAPWSRDFRAALAAAQSITLHAASLRPLSVCNGNLAASISACSSLSLPPRAAWSIVPSSRPLAHSGQPPAHVYIR